MVANPFRNVIRTELISDLANIKITPNGFVAAAAAAPQPIAQSGARTVNYDAFRMVDIEMSNGLSEAASTKKPSKVNGEMDMFKDAANNAFQQFGNFTSASSSSSNASSLSYSAATTTAHNKHDNNNHFNIVGGGCGRNFVDTQQRMGGGVGGGFDSIGFDAAAKVNETIQKRFFFFSIFLVACFA